MEASYYLIKADEMRQLAELTNSDAAKKEFKLLADEYLLLARRLTHQAASRTAGHPDL